MSDLDKCAVLMKKAAQDEWILDRLLNDPRAADAIYGFHAQQAAEKMLKAMLASRAVDYPFTNNIRLLYRLTVKQGVQLPSRFYALRSLTPFAREILYDVLPDEPERPVNRAEIRTMIREFRAWVEEYLSAKNITRP